MNGLRRNRRSDGEADYMERTTLRLRQTSSTYSEVAEFANRLRTMAKRGVGVPDGHIAGAA